MYYVHFQFLTLKSAKALYAYIWIQKDVKFTMNGISEDTVIFLFIESLLISDEQLVYCYSTLLELGMPRTGLEYVLTLFSGAEFT